MWIFIITSRVELLSNKLSWIRHAEVERDERDDINKPHTDHNNIM